MAVLADCDLSFYGPADTSYSVKTKVSNKLRHFFWFPAVNVKAGERIVLRTGLGTNGTFNNSAGIKTHRFFWGLKSAVWNNTGDAAVLFHMDSWKTTRA